MGLMKNSSTRYMRLDSSSSVAETTTTTSMNGRSSGGGRGKGRKGYVPVLVGIEGEKLEKLWLPTKLIAHPHVVALLNTSADEFGYAHRHGLLRITHDVVPFKTMIQSISTTHIIIN